MSRKAVFFDADGTVCDMKKGVPESAIEAIRALVDNGHEAWLCTGRSRAFVSWYLEQIPFTGMISACGSTIEKDGKRLFNKEMTPEVAKLSVEVLRKYGLIPVMEGADFMYYDKEEYTDEVNWYASLITESLGDKWRPIRGNEDCMRINKISAKMTARDVMQRLRCPFCQNTMISFVMRAAVHLWEIPLNLCQKDLTRRWESRQ